MHCFRIIGKIDIKEKNLVKGVSLEGLRVLGKSYEFSKFYYENGADELIYQDVVASLYGKNTLLDEISKTAENIFIPLTVGGGIRTLSDIEKILRSGADKVSINSAALKNPNFIAEAARKFGSSTVAISIEAVKQSDGQYLAYMENGRTKTNKEITNWLNIVQEKGAGEAIITFVDNEGRGLGYDLNFIKKLCKVSKIPIIIHGGTGYARQVVDLVKKTSVSGVAVASMFHYDYIKNKKVQNDFSEGNLDFLLSNKFFNKFQTLNPISLKRKLKMQKIICNI